MRGAASALAALSVIVTSPGPVLALANPASVFCAERGGRSEILQTAGGAQIGVCILPGGQSVEEWAYFRAHHPAPSNPR